MTLRLHTLLCLCISPTLAWAEPAPQESATVQQAAPAEVEAYVRSRAAAVARLRGAGEPPVFSVEVESPDEVRKAVLEDFADPEAQADLVCQDALAKVFGQTSADFDLKAALLDAYADQIAGYYDAERKRLVIVSADGEGVDLSTPLAQMTITHELVHAAQDAAFDLDHLVDRRFLTLDAQLAVQSLVEGDATWWMMPIAAGADPGVLRTLDPSFLLPMVSAQAESIAVESPAVAALPPFARDGLVKPYLNGFLFIHQLQRDAKTGVIDQAFRNPPLSTEMILHPERMYGPFRDLPKAVQIKVNAPMIGKDWEEVCTTGLGEMLMDTGMRFAFSRLTERGLGTDKLTSASQSASSLADGWGGDAIRIFRRADGALAAVWVVAWDSKREPARAHNFASLMVYAAAQPSDPKARNVRASTPRSIQLRAQSHGRVWSAHLRDSTTVFLIGVPAGVEGKVRAALRESAFVEVGSLDEIAPSNQATAPAPLQR